MNSIGDFGNFCWIIATLIENHKLVAERLHQSEETPFGLGRVDNLSDFLQCLVKVTRPCKRPGLYNRKNNLAGFVQTVS